MILQCIVTQAPHTNNKLARTNCASKEATKIKYNLTYTTENIVQHRKFHTFCDRTVGITRQTIVRMRRKRKSVRTAADE